MAVRPDRSENVGLVLAGGGARGAYEIGALSELLPRLSIENRPNIVVGTSIGAINTAYLAAAADECLEQRLERGRNLWRQIAWRKALRPLGSVDDVRLKLRLLGDFAGMRVHARSVFDTSPLKGSLERMLPPLGKIRENIEDDKLDLDAAAVVATRASTSLSVVFADSRLDFPADDRRRGIDYQPAEIELDHVLASAAMPILFPARKIERPPEAQGWYSDGGTRLNTPIKPAIKLGADKLIIVALNCVNLYQGGSREDPPDVLDGASELVQSVLVDPLVNDIHTLVRINRLAADNGGSTSEGDNEIPYILIAPRTPYAIGRLAADWYADRFKGLRKLTPPLTSVEALGHLLDVKGELGFVRGELLSYLLFDEEFADALMELGRIDAQAWLADRPEGSPWLTTDEPPNGNGSPGPIAALSASTPPPVHAEP